MQKFAIIMREGFITMKTQQYVSLLIFALCLSVNAQSPKKSMGMNDYLEISCENIVKKDTQDLFLKQLKNKLAKIHKANGSNSSLNSICEDLGDAQFSRLMEDEFLLFEKK